MRTSESISKISQALVKAQGAITFAAKDAVNPHFRNKYADLPAVIDAIKPALNANGVAFIQLPAPSDPGTLALTTRLLHESGEWIESMAVVTLPKNDPQGYGSAITYLRRYSLAAAVGLYQDDDDGNAASQPPKQTKRPTGVMNDVLNESPAIPAVREQELLKLWETVKGDFEAYGPQAAFERIEQEGLDDLEKIFLSKLMPASTRNAIKAYSIQFHAKQKAA